MKNFVQMGGTLTFVAAAAVGSGQGVFLGTLFGVSVTDVAIGEEGEAKNEGVFELPKAAGALSAGDTAYYDAATHEVDGTATGPGPIGVVTEDAAAGDATVRVRLVPSAI